MSISLPPTHASMSLESSVSNGYWKLFTTSVPWSTVGLSVAIKAWQFSLSSHLCFSLSLWNLFSMYFIGFFPSSCCWSVSIAYIVCFHFSWGTGVHWVTSSMPRVLTTTRTQWSTLSASNTSISFHLYKRIPLSFGNSKLSISQALIDPLPLLLIIIILVTNPVLRVTTDCFFLTSTTHPPNLAVFLLFFHLSKIRMFVHAIYNIIYLISFFHFYLTITFKSFQYPLQLNQAKLKH